MLTVTLLTYTALRMAKESKKISKLMTNMGPRRLQTGDAMLPKQTKHNITTTRELDLYPWEGHMWHYLILLC